MGTGEKHALVGWCSAFIGSLTKAGNTPLQRGEVVGLGNVNRGETRLCSVVQWWGLVNILLPWWCGAVVGPGNFLWACQCGAVVGLGSLAKAGNTPLQRGAVVGLGEYFIAM